MTVGLAKLLPQGTAVYVARRNDTDMLVGTNLVFEQLEHFYRWDGRPARKWHACCTWPECEHCKRDAETVWVEPKALEVVK